MMAIAGFWSGLHVVPVAGIPATDLISTIDRGRSGAGYM
jgi:hypothetical protein